MTLCTLPLICIGLIFMINQSGGNRQDGHERIRVLSQEAGAQVKQEGKENDLLDRIRKDDTFKAVHDKLGLVLIIMVFIKTIIFKTQ